MKTPRIGIVTSQFNPRITEELLRGARTVLTPLLPKDHLECFSVPGAVEIPLVLQRLARTKKYDALIALGVVIRGETGHYEWVCQHVSQGCQHVMMNEDLPVIFGVLTTENREQALDRLGGKKGHKGEEAAQTALAVLETLAQIEGA